MKNAVLLPKDIFTQKLNRDCLQILNKSIEEKMKYLYENGEGEFIIQDGEPYANGELHLGHFLNKTLKDFLTKYYLSMGRKVKISYGWDCHGLPIENKAKELEGDLKTNARNVANKYVEIQDNALKLFGLFPTEGRFKTMDDDFIKREIKLFEELSSKGFIIKKDKPTWYSPTLKTVLANSEIEYKDIEDESLYFLLNCGAHKLLIWTTTEWTVSENQAVVMNPEINYVSANGIIMSESFAKNESLEYTTIDISKFTNYTNHKGDVCPIIKSDYAKDDKTGIVHLCGGHGEEDFNILIENGITPKNVCSKDYLLNHIDSFKVKDEFVYRREKHIHSYPVDWRDGEKVYKILTNQTYLDFNLENIKTCLKEIKLSSKDRNRLSSTIFSRKDWCISRQREWGVKIPNSNDILDVWFDSGSTFTMYDKPVDIYIEGSDQHRGWFQSSILLASMVDRVPTKRIVTHGFVVNNSMNKLSKSEGNYISLEDLYEKYNPDVLRLWVLLSDFKNDIVFSEAAIKTAGKQYFKIRNFIRYLFNNLYILDYKGVDVDDVIRNKMEEFNSKVEVFIEEFDLNKVARLFIDFINSYSSLLSEDRKNEFYESDINSEVRLKQESEFYYILIHLNKVLFALCPFLSAELDLKSTQEKYENKN